MSKNLSAEAKIYKPMVKIRHGSIFTGIGVSLIVLGLAFGFFSSFHIEPTAPTAATLSDIGHYLEGIAIGAANVAVGVLMIFIARAKR
jgi:hypothetical protein